METPFTPFDKEPLNKAKPLQAFFGETKGVHTMESLLGKGPSMQSLLGEGGGQNAMEGDGSMETLFGKGHKPRKKSNDFLGGLFGSPKKKKATPGIANIFPAKMNLMPSMSVGKKAPGARPIPNLFGNLKKKTKQRFIPLLPQQTNIKQIKSMQLKRFLTLTKGAQSQRFIDHDKDRVVSGIDCYPFDKKRHMAIRWGRRPNKMDPEEWGKNKKMIEKITEKEPSQFQLENPGSKLNQITKMNTVLSHDREIKKLNQKHPVFRDDDWNREYNQEAREALKEQKYTDDDVDQYLEAKSRATQNLASKLNAQLEKEGFYNELNKKENDNE